MDGADNKHEEHPLGHRDGGVCLFHAQLDKRVRGWRIAIWSLALALLPLTVIIAGFLMHVNSQVAVLAHSAIRQQKQIDRVADLLLEYLRAKEAVPSHGNSWHSHAIPERLGEP